MIQIEPNIPIPKRNKFEFMEDMNFGDSFVLDNFTDVSNARVYALRHGFKISQHRMAHNKWRVWKVEK